MPHTLKWRIPLFICLTLSCLSAIAQDTSIIRSKIRELDSLQALQYQQRRNLDTRPPLFPQYATKKFIRNTRSFMPGQAGIIKQSSNLTVCYDTSGRFFLQNDTITFYPGCSVVAADGKLLVTGEFVGWGSPNRYGGFLLKCNDSGAIDWMKLYDTVANTTYNESWYYYLNELKDGSILMTGQSNDIVTGNDDVLLTRVTSTGNIIWNRSYKSRLWQTGNGSADYFWIKQVKQDPWTGDIFLAAGLWDAGSDITRFRLSDGDIQWSNVYSAWGALFHHPFGIDILENEIISFNKVNSHILSILRLNKGTGDTISNKLLRIIDTSNIRLGFVTTEGVTRLNNGHYAIHGRLMTNFIWPVGSTVPLYHVGVIELDANFNFVRADAFLNDEESNGNNTRITVFPDGSGFYSMLKYISGYTDDVYYVQFKEGQILKQRVKHYVGEGMPAENTAVKMPDGGNMIVKLIGDSINSINKIEFLNLHLSDTSSNCLGETTTNNFTIPYNLEDLGTNSVLIQWNDLAPSRNKTFAVNDLPLNLIPGCNPISHCDTLSLVPSADSICVATPVTVVFRRNAACGATPFIRYDTSRVQSFRIVNDSTYEFVFKTPGTTKLTGTIFGCSLVEDSISMAVFQSPGPLSIGPDSVICPGNRIRLVARPGYKYYRWQDNSTDSVFIVTQPGLYWVRATDSCGNNFSDTMQVAPHPPIPFDIGADITICEKDTATITAPSSFINYQWSPNYNISNPFAQTVKVYPQHDTTYQVQAEKTPGCFVYDTIKVFVHTAPPIYLGADQSFCSGDSLVLNAGPGFASYLWNNGKTGPSVTAFSSGLYIVNAATPEGCHSTDSLNILNVYANPLVNLGNDSVICTGTIRIIDAGNYSSYLWSTGANTKTISINRTGTYAVMVVDNNGCHGGDTLIVNKPVNPPAQFLPADTTICTYSKFIVSPLFTYNSYAWNTGTQMSNITITKPGIYWLTVKDRDNCLGRDSIVVTGKDCLTGFFVPNAFTPNRDGRNDLFRPLIFGLLEKYEFQVFNRWGQLVFKTTDYSRGWDGGTNSITGGYTWVCRYQLEGEKIKVEKGTVLLVR